MSHESLNDIINQLLMETPENSVHSKNRTADGKKKDPKTEKPTAQATGKNEVEGSNSGNKIGGMHTGQDEGDMNKGKIASGASDNSKEIGLKGGGSETPLNQNNGMDDKAPKGDKGEFPSDACTSVEADKGPHDQGSDAFETPTKANPKGTVKEEEEIETEEALEEKAKEESVDNPGDDDGDAIDQDIEKKDVKEEKDEDDDEGEDDDDDDDKEETVSEAGVISKKPVKKEIPGSDGKVHTGKETEANREQRPPEEKGDNAPVTKGGDPEHPPSWGEEKEENEEEGLEEEFKEKAQIIFETAVNEKVAAIREDLEEDYKAFLDESLGTINERVEEYLNYAVQEWIDENQLEIKYSLRTEIAENFIRGLRGLFEESYIEIPEDEIDVVDELTESVEGYKERITEMEDELAEAKYQLLALNRVNVVNELAEDLTQTQAIKLHSLAEHVEADDIEEFTYKVSQLKEANFIDTESNSYSSLTEEVIYDDGSVDEEEVGGAMSVYANFLGKTAK